MKIKGTTYFFKCPKCGHEWSANYRLAMCPHHCNERVAAGGKCKFSAEIEISIVTIESKSKEGPLP